jgi:hypothetical protein
MMPRALFGFSATVLSLALAAGAAPAQAAMKPTAPQKMTSPDQKKQMDACEKQAAQRNIAMDQRAKFVMDCMTTKAK